MSAVIVEDFNYWAGTSDSGTSTAAVVLKQFLKDTEKSLRTAKTWNVFGETYDELNEVYQECSDINWDGYGAAPIFASAFEEAMSFVKALPSNIPPPEVTPEPDGSLGFEWNNGESKIFAVSLNGKGTIYYAGLLGKGIKAHGTEIFDNTIPEEIIKKIKRIYS